MTARLWMLTRKHPPSLGGMQQLSLNLVKEQQALGPVTVIAWGGSQLGLPFFFLKAFVRVALGLARREISVLHLGDPALAALACLPRWRGVPVAVTVHGLDITFPGRLYQFYLRLFFWNRMDAYIGISRHVCDLILAKGMPADRVHLIPVGIGPPPAIGTADPVLLARLDVAFPVLGMVGRLVERKGVPWFLAEVAGQWLPRHPKARLVIAGDGPMRQRIEALVAQLGLGDQVIVSGEIPEAMKWWLMARSDLMLMPNVPVAGDAEGFGLVALESASVGTWVAVSDLEGLRDAVSEGGNGSRIEAKNARAWNSALERLCGDRDALQEMGERAREFVAENCSWAAIGARYSSLFQALASHAT